MLVPRPRKIKEMRKNAASTMETNLTQKLILSRFIIMAVYPPGSSGAETIVYHVAANDGGRDSLACGSFENAPFGIPILLRGLDHGEVGPLPHLERTRSSLDTERSRPSQRCQLEARRPAHTVQLHREQRLLEEVHARAAPEPICSHTYPDATGDHGGHGRVAAPEVGVRTGAVRHRYAGLRQNLYVLLGDSRRQVCRYGLWGQQLYTLRVADGRDAHSSPLVGTEDVREAAGTKLQELDLLGALGEVDRKSPPQLPRPTRGQTRRLRVYCIRGMDADLRVHTLRQPFPKPSHLRDYELDGLLRGADLMREELGVDGPRHPAFGELRQAFSVGG